MAKKNNRNFCIIAHIDHGKSTLADRLIELTGALKNGKAQEQMLDSMELERERGITIKAKAIRLSYKAKDGEEYNLNLIDTPGHVDFSYEVSRTLAACEGAILVIDATQGIQSQTLANVYTAMEHDLAIIPVINKIDLPGSEVERVIEEIESVLGYTEEEILLMSAKTGQGVPELLEAIVKEIPAPKGDSEAPLRALIFDSHYDSYLGVVAYFSVTDGAVKKGEKLRLMGQGTELEAVEIGYNDPKPCKVGKLSAGDIGYIATGLKSVSECRVGDTLTTAKDGAKEILMGYEMAKPMVFTGIYTTQPEEHRQLREAIEKLSLNDASFTFEPESMPVLGNGFRCGFLGLLHMDIIRERLEREFNLSLIVTVPGVRIIVTKTDGEKITVVNPSEMPESTKVKMMEEPWVKISVITPSSFIGPIMELVTEAEGVYKHTEYIGQSHSPSKLGQRVRLEYELPLRSMLTTFYDQLKSCSRGYASLDHELIGYRETKLERLDILVNGVVVDAFSRMIPEHKARATGRVMVEKLKEFIPRQMFKVPIQAAMGGQFVARADISAKRKDVLAKCYGGDITRKRKLLEKQKEGKKKMKSIGKVEVPKEAFMNVLKLD